MNLLSNLKKIRVQHVDRDAKGVEIKTDVDVITDADCITMDDGDLRSGVKKMIDDRIGEVIDGAPEELDTLKEIAMELEKNQSGVSTILNKMNSKLEAKYLDGYAKTADVDKKLISKIDADSGKGLSTNDYTNVDKQKVNALDVTDDNKKLVYKQKRNTDFNNITEAGFYTVQTSTNAPHNQYDYWSLLVLNSTSVDSGTYVQQIAINEKTDDRAIYVRKKSSKWSSWIKLGEAPDLSGYAKESDVGAKIYDLGSEINSTNMDIGEIKDVIGKLATKKADKKDMVDLKRCIVLTQAEYNALSDEEKGRDDTLYFIKA